MTLDAAEKLPSKVLEDCGWELISRSIADRLSYENDPVIGHAGTSITLADVSLHAKEAGSQSRRQVFELPIKRTNSASDDNNLSRRLE